MKILIPVALALFAIQVLVLYASDAHALSVSESGPLYKPASRSPEPVDIATDAYGGSELAPDALLLGESVPEFTLPMSGGGEWGLGSKGPITAIIFYRGHW